MYGFREQFNWQSLVGLELESVTYAAHVIVLQLGAEIVFSVKGPLGVDEHMGAVLGEDPSEPTGRLVTLPGQTVNSVAVESTSLLRLQLSSGVDLILYDDDPQWEALTMEVTKTERIVI